MNLQMLNAEQLESLLLGEWPASLRATPRARHRHQRPQTALDGEGDSRAKRVKRRLSVARELLLRRQHADLVGSHVLDSPEKARDYLRLHFSNLNYEVFVAVLLNVRLRVLECRELFRGTVAHVSVYPREVVRVALEVGAGSLIVAHNHPAGVADASSADELLTARLKAALDLVDVRLIDHVVFGDGEFHSFAENRQL